MIAAAASDQIDPCALDNGGCQGRIAGHERSPGGFGEGERDRVVRRDVVAELPNPRQEKAVRVAHERKVREVFERLKTSDGIELARSRVTPEHLGHLKVQEMLPVKVVGNVTQLDHLRHVPTIRACG